MAVAQEASVEAGLGLGDMPCSYEGQTPIIRVRRGWGPGRV